jgi:hypothetical protein
MPHRRQQRRGKGEGKNDNYIFKLYQALTCRFFLIQEGRRTEAPEIITGRLRAEIWALTQTLQERERELANELERQRIQANIRRMNEEAVSMEAEIAAAEDPLNRERSERKDDLLASFARLQRDLQHRGSGGSQGGAGSSSHS